MSTVQSVLFRKKYWTQRKAGLWLKEHGFQKNLVEETKLYFRFRQKPTMLMKPGTYVTLTKNLPLGVYLVTAEPRTNPGLTERQTKLLCEIYKNELPAEASEIDVAAVCDKVLNGPSTLKQYAFEIGLLKSRKENPGSIKSAVKEYEEFQGVKADKLLTLKTPPGVKLPPSAFLGRVIEITYLTQKAEDEESTEYQHKFEKQPSLLSVPGANNGKRMMVITGNFKITDRGIEG